MEKFFKNALKVSIASLVISITLYIVIIAFFLLSVVTANIFGTVIKIIVPILILVTILGFIYSFFIKGKQKIPFLTLHFVSLCVLSFGIYLAVSFQGFAPYKYLHKKRTLCSYRQRVFKFIGIGGIRY
ncbi:hypothetical protein [Priestia megaterium]|uniref:hypothetical protein n=1 Tax=Priestia megaterium TaxID=1404 RepID=UPI000AB71C45|nr:hypothetical protein [Priestia megaterium]MCE4092133.1 hypothetical protein [Priestia megaterium]